ncbi:MAG: hypothetical protein OXF63_09825 [Anaerolineaceae bacterium]|nr:hypothetical protein [Anaerolineaceae bacterium]
MEAAYRDALGVPAVGVMASTRNYRCRLTAASIRLPGINDAVQSRALRAHYRSRRRSRVDGLDMQTIVVITTYTIEIPARSMDGDSPEERTITVEEFVTVCTFCTQEEVEAGTCPADC